MLGVLVATTTLVCNVADLLSYHFQIIVYVELNVLAKPLNSFVRVGESQGVKVPLVGKVVKVGKVKLLCRFAQHPWSRKHAKVFVDYGKEENHWHFIGRSIQVLEDIHFLNWLALKKQLTTSNRQFWHYCATLLKSTFLIKN